MNENDKKKKVKSVKRAEHQKNDISHWYSKNEITKIIFIFIIVTIVFIAFYFLTMLIKNNTSSDDVFIKNEGETIIQYEKIMVGEILNMTEGSYYVLVLKDFDKNGADYKKMVDSYLLKDNVNKIYYVDLKSGFNKNYLSSNSNFEVSNIADIKFKDDTLLKIENSKFVNSYENRSEIMKYLKTL